MFEYRRPETGRAGFALITSDRGIVGARIACDGTPEQMVENEDLMDAILAPRD